MKLLQPLLLLLACSFSLVSGWGKLGHQIVANIAWERLSPAYQELIRHVLIRPDGSYGNDEDAGSPLAAIANWADKVRYTSAYHWSGPLHFVDIEDTLVDDGCPVHDPGQLSDCNFVWERDCQDDICAAGAIANYSQRILQSQKVDTIRRDDFEFLVHFVGDLHQPLHASRKSDRGGNSIDVDFDCETTDEVIMQEYGDGIAVTKSKWNLHSIWDHGIIDKALSEFYHDNRTEFEGFLIDMVNASATNGDLDLWLACGDGGNKACTTIWAQESFSAAIAWAYRNVDGNPVESIIGRDYYITRLEVIKRRLVAGGVRLGRTLELILQDKLILKSNLRPATSIKY